MLARTSSTAESMAFTSPWKLVDAADTAQSL